MIEKKIVKKSSLLLKLKKLRNKGRKIVFTNGCFDILHAGHIQYLRQAKSCGDILVVGLNSDVSVRKIKGKKRPVTKEKDRALILAALGMVDFVVKFNAATPLSLIKAVKPDVLVKGADWKEKDIVGSDFLKSYGGKIKRVAFRKGYSTTKIISLISSGFK